MDIRFKRAFDGCVSSMVKRLNDGSRCRGMGLVGLDGAAQAGQIRRELWELPDLHRSVPIARAAPRDLPCDCGRPCCVKHTPNEEWRAAIAWLTNASAAYASSFSHYQVRLAIVERIFGLKCNLANITRKCDAHVDTVSKYNAVIR